MQSQIIIFTDGASSGNPGPGGWGAIVAYDGKVTELGGGEIKTTNNRMELNALLQSLKFTVDQGLSHQPVTLYTDSSYVANGAMTWIKGWQKRNWTNQAGEKIANVDLWQEVARVLPDVQLRIINVSGHSGVQGNERADQIATAFVRETSVPLYHGAYSEYHFDLENLSMDIAQKKTKDRKKEKAFSYLSLVNGELKIHMTWEDCKRRVEGVKGAKYKKSVSKVDEDAIRTKWRV